MGDPGFLRDDKKKTSIRSGNIFEMNDLLAADEPSSVRILRPEGASDLLLAADHAGRLIPRALGTLGLDEVERGRHIAWDIGIAAVTEQLAELLDATAILQTYSRLVIDC